MILSHNFWYVTLSYADRVAEGMDMEAGSEPVQSWCSSGGVQRQLCVVQDREV